jgi:hypothetical protein
VRNLGANVVDFFSSIEVMEIETMQAHRLHVTVPEDRRAMVEFPETVPTGEVELIVLVPAETEAPAEKASQEALARWDAAAAEVDLDPRSFHELTLEERRARLRRLRGIGKGLLPSSEEFLSQKREEVEIEERKLAR